MDKVLILGASGLVGKALTAEVRHAYDVYGTFFSKPANLPEDKLIKLDIQEIKKMKEYIKKIQPDMVVSCLTGDFDQQLHFHHELAQAIQDSHCLLYFISTTNVFDGDFSRGHDETDEPKANSDYGKFKIKCEKMLWEVLGKRTIIIRIPAIWGKDSPRWNDIQNSIINKKPIDVYSNLIWNNLLDVQLAKQIRYIMDNRLEGIIHLGSIDEMTQAQFYERIICQISKENNILRHHLYEGKEDAFYFRLESTRDDIPKSLQFTNDAILKYLLNHA